MPASDDRPAETSAARERHLMREATEWFMRRSVSDFTAEQQAELDAWRRRNAAHDRAFLKVSGLWASPELTVAAKRVAGAAEDGFMARSSRRRWSIPSRVAAVAAAILLVGMAWGYRDVLTWIQADYVTSIGERRAVTLPDQSIVTMNTDSAIAVQYETARRSIRLLRGEASFSVQPDAHRPFTVETQGVEATALGTEFVVRERAPDVQVTVLHGSVKVADRMDQVVKLAPGDQVVVGRQGPGPVMHVDTASSAAWMHGRLVFVRAPLAEVVRELSRYHRGYLTVWNTSLDSLPVTGIYNLKDPARVVTTLADTLPIHVVRLTDHMIVIR